MHLMQFYLVFLFILQCFAGPLEDLANMPDLSLFYQQLVRHQDIQMLLQGMFPQQQQQQGALNEFTIFAPTNDAMASLTGRNEDWNLLWKYHIVPGRYDEQILGNLGQEKFNQANPRQPTAIRPQNNLPTIAVPFQVFVGLGFYGGLGPQVNETYDNAGYGAGGISWLTHTSINQTNSLEINQRRNSYPTNNYNLNNLQGNLKGRNANIFPQNYTNSYPNTFNPNINPQISRNMNYNPYLQQQTNGQMSQFSNMGVLRPTINNAFILQSRPMSRGIINVIDSILWLPERRDQMQYKTAYDVLEDAQFSRIRQLAERSDYFRSELRSIHHQTWFLPNDQAFASIGSSLSFLLDQTSINNTNDINEFIRSHVIPLVIFPDAMDSTKQIITSNGDKWITFREILHQDQRFQIDVISGRHVARILISRPEEIRFYANGIVYPISNILYTQLRSGADELSGNYQYFMTLVQQSGDLELINLLQGPSNFNMYGQQNLFNITILVPQQTSIQQLGNPQELSMNLRRHILRFPVYTDQFMSGERKFSSNTQHKQQPQQQPVLNSQPNIFQPNQQQNVYQANRQQPINPQQNTYQMSQQQQQPQQNMFQTGQQQQQINSQQNMFQTGQQQPVNPQQNVFQNTQQQQINPQQNMFQPNQQQQQQQQQPINPQQNFYQSGQQNQFMQQPFQRTGSLSDKTPRLRRQINVLPNTNFQAQQQQMPFNPLQQQIPAQPILPVQQQVQMPIQPILQAQQQIPIPQAQQQIPIPTQQILQSQQQGFSPMASLPTSAIFQNGQVYPTMDPQFNVQAQVSTSPNGNIVTLIGQSMNSLPFSATIRSSESNIQIKNGVMHVIRGILSGTVLPIENVLSLTQGTSAFTQLLQQTGVFNQLRQANRPYTLFIPTNAALQSIGITNDVNRLRQFVMRHICADVLLDPTSNVLRRSAGYYKDGMKYRQKIPRQKRQIWQNNRPNLTNLAGRQVLSPTDLGPGYFQPQQQVYGGYPAAPTQFGINNQLYNPNMNFNNTINMQFNNQEQMSSGYPSGTTYTQGPQSCMAMTGERITVQSLAGFQPEGNTPSMSYQNYMVTCCSDQSVNSLVQSFNIYPPNFAVYLLGRTLLSQGQTINSMYNSSIHFHSSSLMTFIFILLIIFKQIQYV